MAKVWGPALSIDASGTVADTLTYSNWKGVKYARMWFSPSNPQTTNQMIQRSKFSSAVLGWQGQSSTVKTAWNTAATAYKLSGFNYFVQQYLDQGSYLSNQMPVIPGS